VVLLSLLWLVGMILRLMLPSFSYLSESS
jgi:hypothetical protein